MHRFPTVKVDRRLRDSCSDIFFVIIRFPGHMVSLGTLFGLYALLLVLWGRVVWWLHKTGRLGFCWLVVRLRLCHILTLGRHVYFAQWEFFLCPGQIFILLAVFILFGHEILRFLTLSIETESCGYLVFDKGLWNTHISVLRVLTVVEDLWVKMHLAISVDIITTGIITVRWIFSQNLSRS